MGWDRKIAVFMGALLMTVSAAAQPGSGARPDLATIVQKMEQAQLAGREDARPYVVTRDYRFFEGQEKAQADSEVTAEVSYYPPNTKQFAIREAKGNGRGERVVKKVLEHEQQMSSSWRENAITADNYKFSLLGEETLNGRRCFVLGLEPRRNAKELLEGKAWVDASNYRILLIHGQPAKNPSFWIKKVDVTLYFSEVEGMWLQTAIRAVADVRLFGTHILSERDLKYRVGDESVAKRVPRRPETTIATYVR